MLATQMDGGPHSSSQDVDLNGSGFGHNESTTMAGLHTLLVEGEGVYLYVYEEIEGRLVFQ